MFDSGNDTVSMIGVTQSKVIAIILIIRYTDICLSPPPLFFFQKRSSSFLCFAWDSPIQNPFQVSFSENRLNFSFKARKAVASWLSEVEDI